MIVTNAFEFPIDYISLKRTYMCIVCLLVCVCAMSVNGDEDWHALSERKLDETSIAYLSLDIDRSGEWRTLKTCRGECTFLVKFIDRATLLNKNSEGSILNSTIVPMSDELEQEFHIYKEENVKHSGSEFKHRSKPRHPSSDNSGIEDLSNVGPIQINVIHNHCTPIWNTLNVPVYHFSWTECEVASDSTVTNTGNRSFGCRSRSVVIPRVLPDESLSHWTAQGRELKVR